MKTTFKHFIKKKEWYHFSTAENLDTITKEKWLESGEDAVHGRGIYFTDDRNFRRLPFLIVELDAPRIINRPDGSQWAIETEASRIKIIGRGDNSG